MHSYKIHFSQKKFVLSFVSGTVFLAISLFIQFLASNYTTRTASGSVADIILSNIGPYNVGGIFVWGSVLLLFIGLYVGLTRVNSMPFAMKSVALFTLIRSFFVSLTHISPFPTHISINSTFFNHSFFNGIFNGNDLFFSGHTGLPFLLALIFWENKHLRFIFLGFSITFATVVLLGHIHYSIDVLSAYFITFTIFHLCKFFFKKDWELLSGEKSSTELIP